MLNKQSQTAEKGWSQRVCDLYGLCRDISNLKEMIWRCGLG